MVFAVTYWFLFLSNKIVVDKDNPSVKLILSTLTKALAHLHEVCRLSLVLEPTALSFLISDLSAPLGEYLPSSQS